MVTFNRKVGEFSDRKRLAISHVLTLLLVLIEIYSIEIYFGSYLQNQAVRTIFLFCTSLFRLTNFGTLDFGGFKAFCS